MADLTDADLADRLDEGRSADREARELQAALTASREREKMLAEALADRSCNGPYAPLTTHTTVQDCVQLGRDGCRSCRALAAYREANRG